MIRFTCSCGKAYQLKEEMGGKRVKCPACQGVMTVPVPAALAGPLEPVSPGGLVPLEGLPPIGAGDLFASLPPAGPVSTAPLGPSPGFAAPGFAPAPLTGPAATHAAYGGTGIPPLVWIIAGTGGAAVVVIAGVVVAIALSFGGGNSSPVAQSPVGSAPTSSASGGPGAPGSAQAVPAGAGMPQLNKPTVNRDWRGRESIGSEVGKWQVFTSEEGGYQINLPGKPQVVPQSMNTPSGKISGSVATIGSDASGLVIVITHLDVPYDPTVVPIDKLTEMQIGLQGGQIIRTTDVMVSGKPGKEFYADIKKDRFVGKAVFRTLAAGGRVFMLAYLGQSNRFNEGKAAECLNSFVLTREPPPAPKGNGKKPFNAGIPIARDVSWTKQESTQHHFRVELPAPGKRIETTPEEMALQETWMCEVAGKGAFSCNATAYKIPVPQAALPGAVALVKAELAKTFGSVVHESTSQQGNVQVCDFVFNHPSGMRALVRGYLTSKVAYQLTWMGQPELAQSEEVTRFFNSFAMTTPSAESQSPQSGQPKTP